MTDETESWAVVELLGHVTMAGRLSEEERFGTKLGRLDCPNDDGGFTTVLFGGDSIYRITPVSEAIARAKARAHQPRPIYAYELPPEKPVVRSLGRHLHDDDDLIDPDFGPDHEDDREDDL